MRKPQTEAGIEGLCRLHAKRHGHLLLKWTSPGTAGVPDRILLCAHGPVAFIEFKRPGAPLTPLQAYWRQELLARGQTHAVVHSITEFQALLTALSATGGDPGL